jgi:hypothetical protein
MQLVCPKVVKSKILKNRKILDSEYAVFLSDP